MENLLIFLTVRQCLEKLYDDHNGEFPPIAIYPFGKDGWFVKHILNEQFGVAEKYLVDNSMCRYNPGIISSDELMKKDEDIVVLVSTTSRSINEQICCGIKASGNKRLEIANIVEPIVYLGDNSDSYYDKLLKELHPSSLLGHGFVRVGRDNDGGYIMVDDLNDKMTAYSFGICDDMSWDEHINDLSGMCVNMYDHTIDRAPGRHKGCVFNKIGLGSVDNAGDDLLSLETILKSNDDLERKDDLILKMDIEGAEWDAFDTISDEVLGCFRQMVFELHDMNDKKTDYREKRLRVLQKLNRTHRVLWIHGNNFTSGSRINGMIMPDAIEVLYASQSCYRFDENKRVVLPFEEDMPNLEIRNDYDMSFLTDPRLLTGWT